MYRFVLQVVFWMVIWIVLWITGGTDQIFLATNVPAFFFQVILLAGLLFYAIPKVLLKNRTLLFVIGVLVGVVVLGSELDSTVVPELISLLLILHNWSVISLQ